MRGAYLDRSPRTGPRFESSAKLAPDGFGDRGIVRRRNYSAVISAEATKRNEAPPEKAFSNERTLFQRIACRSRITVEYGRTKSIELEQLLSYVLLQGDLRFENHAGSHSDGLPLAALLVRQEYGFES